MKKWFVLPILLLSLCMSFNCSKDNKSALKGTITLSGAWALYPMAVRWAEEFQKINPSVRIDIAAGGAGKGMADCLAGAVDIGMVSRDIHPEEIEKGAWFVPVTKDAVVPTINAGNPALSDLMASGVKKADLIGIWITGGVTHWAQIAKPAANHPIHVYTRSDACGAAETWAHYLGKNQEDLKDIGVYGDPGLAEAVRNDIYGIGFNNINYAYDSKTKNPVQGIAVLPLDLDENGKLDPKENFYGTLDEIVQAIADGRYPSPPARDLNFVCKGVPEKPIVRDFISWILTEGQKFVGESGYIPLGEDKLKEGSARLGNR